LELKKKKNIITRRRNNNERFDQSTPTAIQVYPGSTETNNDNGHQTSFRQYPVLLSRPCYPELSLTSFQSISNVVYQSTYPCYCSGRRKSVLSSSLFVFF
jgi:hypothetical protein